jgi:hypothetical protein
MHLKLAWPEAIPPTLVFIKLECPRERRLGFFDSAGWRAVLVPRGSASATEKPKAQTEARTPLEAGKSRDGRDRALVPTSAEELPESSGSKPGHISSDPVPVTR